MLDKAIHNYLKTSQFHHEYKNLKEAFSTFKRPCICRYDKYRISNLYWKYKTQI